VSAAGRLRAGEVLLLTTDTLPGLHTLATLPGAAQRLRSCKGSPPGRPFLLLFASADDVLRVARPADVADAALLRRAWPGPLTAVLLPAAGTPGDWTDQGRTLAARVPACEALCELIAEVGGPLFSTSANPAGLPPAIDLAAARDYFPDLEVHDLGGGALRAASTIMDLSTSPARLVRQGAAVWPPLVGAP
jgi:L-threonylcarbamoyladenylate synthase